MHVLFANTGVQTICVPLQSGRRYTTAQIGYGWQYCQCFVAPEEEEEEDESGTKEFAFIQWQIVQANVSKVYLAIDTSLGDPDEGYFCDPTSLSGDFHVKLEGLLDLTGSPLAGVPKIDICLRAASATAGEAKPVHMVVDFGNSRTGALLLEMSGEVTQSAEMLPFELANRYSLDQFNDAGEQIDRPQNRWFSSKTRWCNTPYKQATEVVKKEYFKETVKGFLRSKQVAKHREVTVRPTLFDDISMVRMGREVDDVSQIMHARGDFRTGVSSPKRYLWARDPSWLEGAFWYMADPHDRDRTDTFAAKLHGPLLKFVHEDDRDFLLDEDKLPDEDDFGNESPIKPQHAPRCLMTAAVYEMLCQAYVHVNSIGYRSGTSDEARSREVRSLTMTYPSGMYHEERERFRRQVQKAIEIFSSTIGKHQKVKPHLTFSIDEASAVHLTYIWSELRMLGQDPRLWFSALSRDHSAGSSGGGEDGEDDAPAEATGAVAAGRRRNRGRVGRPGRPGKSGSAAAVEDEDTSRNELRIACIDVGGGTTDMMIASYRYQPGIDDSIQGKVLHTDGVSVAGDQLVKRLLERIIVPHFSEAIGLDDEDIQLLFGPEVPKNRGFTSQRIDWMNRIFIPIAERYLQMAVDGVTDEEITHTEPETVDPMVVESLQQQCNKLRGPGYYNIQQELGLTYSREAFDDVCYEVFDDLLFDFCTRIVDYEADVVLLAGQPSKLAFVQNLVRMYVPLPASRVIPMHNHYAGNWYPYQDVKGHAPGLIVDPKSAVVVGAAIEFMARHGMLPQFKFAMQGKETENTYYWGVMTEQTAAIREERILFGAADPDTRDEWTEFNTTSQRVVVGRKVSGDAEAQASPIYAIKMEVGDRIGPTDVTIRVKRLRATEKTEEHLSIESVQGSVAGEPAVLGENVIFDWRTLADERFYLDTGGLDNIEVEGR